MPVSISPTQRAAAAGAAAAVLLLGAFMLGASRGSAASAGTAGPSAAAGPAPAGRITVTGTGTVSGTPSQLQLSMGVQTSGATVGDALGSASQAVRAVTRALTVAGVRSSDIATSGLSIQPEYPGGGTVPDGYGVSESLAVTLRSLRVAGTQISDAVHAGGNATVVDGVSLNLTDTSSLLASARSKAVADARAKAAQYARALGRALGPAVSMSETAPQQPLPEFAGAASAKSSGVPVSPGSQQLTVTVTVVFALA